MKYYKNGFISLILVAFALGSTAQAAVPGIINFQGRVVKNDVNFDGSGKFKFVLVDGTGTVLWSHNGDSSGTNGEPNGFVSQTVTNGLYSVGLGDESSPLFMDPIPAGILSITARSICESGSAMGLTLSSNFRPINGSPRWASRWWRRRS